MREESERASLKAVLFADLEQYSRMIAADERNTLEYVARCFDIFRSHCLSYRAEFIKTTGDGVLILFDSAAGAVEYAMAIQERLCSLTDPQKGMGRFRIGLHLGEVHRRGGDAFGHAVNIAARVQTQALPGGVCVTQEVYGAARTATRYGYRFAGRALLKNLPEPVVLYHVTARAASGAVAPEPRLRIAVIDGLMMESEAQEVIPLRSRKARALIGYLALSDQFQDAQDRIAALIWPVRRLEDARRALRSCLHGMEKSASWPSTKPLLRRGNLIGFKPSEVGVDVVRMFGHLIEGKVDDVLLERSDWADAILLGLEEVSGVYSAWLSVTRHNWRDRTVEALENVLERFQPNEPALRRAATALLVLEPSHEHAAQSLIRHYASSHNLPAAMRVFEQLCQTLREGFQLEPSEETASLVDGLARTRASSYRQRTLRPRRAQVPTIAVAEFRSRKRSIAHQVAGFRSELISNLSKFRHWTVVEWDKSTQAAEYVLSAESAYSHPQMQISLALTDPATRKVIWSDSFVLSISDWIAVQKEIVGRIASTMDVYLSRDRLSRVLQNPRFDLDAYDAWLRGESLLAHWSGKTEDEAELLFEQAIRDDPNFAPAYASLASVHNSRHFIRPGVRPKERTRSRALDLARRAVELDPLDARNQLVVAWSAAMAGQFEQAELHFELAAELNPNSPKTLISAGLGLVFMGRRDLAKDLLECAMSLSSMFLDYQWSHIATIRYFCGDYEGVLRAADRSKNVIVDTPGWKAAALQQLGRTDEARDALMQLYSAVARIWEGGRAATHQDVLRWYCSAFPIKHEEDRGLLAKLRLLV